jgi:hypothetical protein
MFLVPFHFLLDFPCLLEAFGCSSWLYKDYQTAEHLFCAKVYPRTPALRASGKGKALGRRKRMQ